MDLKFSLVKVKELFDTAPFIEKVIKNKVTHVKDITAVTNYLKEYIFPLTTGDHLLYQNNDIDIKDTKTICQTYFKRMDKLVNDWYFTENLDLYTMVNKVDKPFGKLENNEFNAMAGIKHNTYKKFAEYPEEIKNGVNKMLFHIEDVICSGNKEVSKYITLWMANLCQGRKNDSALYIRSTEGVEKSTVWDFLTQYVVGQKASTKGTPESLTTGFNIGLLGKRLVIYEELPTFSESQWSGVSGKLKDMITGSTISIMAKGKDAFVTSNTNNYIFITNEPAIKGAHGRRYCEPDISTKMIGKYEYFEDLNKSCFNDEVGEAFYAYLMEQDISRFNAQKDMPTTQRKLDEIVARLENSYAFIKDRYVLKGQGIDKKASDLYREYSEYCTGRSLRPLKNTIFYQKLQDVNIVQKTLHGYKVYKYSAESLLATAKNKKWLHETDEFLTKDSKKPDFSKCAFDDLENGIDDADQAITQDNETAKLIEENKKLRERIKELESKNQDQRYEQLVKNFKDAGYMKPKTTKPKVQPKKAQEEIENDVELVFDLNNF